MSTASTRGDADILAQFQSVLEESEDETKGAVSKKDVINFNAFMSFRSLFPENIEIHSGSVLNVYPPPIPTFCVEGCIHVYRIWRWTSLYDEPGRSPGSWRCQMKDGTYCAGGEDIVSLLASLHSGNLLKMVSGEIDEGRFQRLAALCRAGGAEQTVLADIVQKLAINPESPTLKMPSIPYGWVQSDWAYPSTKGVAAEVVKAHGHVRAVACVYLPFLRFPSQIFEICDEQGRPQAAIASWETSWNGPVMAWFLPCHREDDPSEQQWMLARPTRKLVPFGLEVVAATQDATVVIDDDLHNVRRITEGLQELFSPSPTVLAGWPKRMPGAKPSDTDWSVLKGRDVVCSVSNDAESFKDGLALGQEIDGVGVDSFKFALPWKRIDGHEAPQLSDKSGRLDAELVSWQQFQEIAKERFGLAVEHSASAVKSQIWTLGDPSPNGVGAPKYLLEPIIPKASATLLYSAPGVGKSWLALLISYAIGGGTEILGGRWKASSRHNCLYISTEMAEQNVKRLIMIDQSIRCQGAQGRVTIKPHPDEPYQKIDFETEEAWDRLSRQIDDADFIVIDHLTNVTSAGEIGIKTWKRLWGFIAPLRQKGKTFLILHHEGKTGAQRGTSVLEADVDTMIRMEELSDVENGALISFKKYRDDESLGRAFAPFKLLWDQGDEPGTFRWQAEELAEEEQGKKYASFVERRLQIDEAALEAKFGKGRPREIVKLLAEAALRNKPGLSTGDLVDGVGCSSTTVRTEIKHLVQDGVVMQSGVARATRYALSDSVLHDVTGQ